MQSHQLSSDGPSPSQVAVAPPPTDESRIAAAAIAKPPLSAPTGSSTAHVPAVRTLTPLPLAAFAAIKELHSLSQCASPAADEPTSAASQSASVSSPCVLSSSSATPLARDLHAGGEVDCTSTSASDSSRASSACSSPSPSLGASPSTGLGAGTAPADVVGSVRSLPQMYRPLQPQWPHTLQTSASAGASPMAGVRSSRLGGGGAGSSSSINTLHSRSRSSANYPQPNATASAHNLAMAGRLAASAFAGTALAPVSSSSDPTVSGADAASALTSSLHHSASSASVPSGSSSSGVTASLSALACAAGSPRADDGMVDEPPAEMQTTVLEAIHNEKFASCHQCKTGKPVRL